jgi:hypothetical protein
MPHGNLPALLGVLGVRTADWDEELTRMTIEE